MLIQCTKKLLDELKIKPESTSIEEASLFSWHANFLTINRKKTVVLVNDSNRYVIVLYGLLAKDLRKLDELIIESIQVVFREERIAEEITQQFITHAPQITYTKTKDRTSVARMNKSIEPVYVFNDLLDQTTMIQTELSLRASRYLVGDGTGNYIDSNRELYKDLEAFSGKNTFQIQAVQLKVTLNLDHFKVWRRIIVPTHLNFRQLHEILQRAFEWQDCHLHEFYVYDRQVETEISNKWGINHGAHHSEGKTPIINIVSHAESFDYGDDDIPMALDTKIKLSDYLPAYNTIRYNYDFGDDWRHNIEMESHIENYDKNYPTCLDGAGTTPPEDVGGETGYMNFLEIIADQSNPDREQMISWGQSQKYREFDIEQVNRFLKFDFY